MSARTSPANTIATRGALSWLAVWGTAAALAWLFSATSWNLEASLAQPSWLHPFGRDAFGRDVLAITLHASLLSAAFSLASVLVATVLAMSLGLGAALAPPWIRSLLIRAIEATLAFPSLLFALGWAALHGPGWGTLAFSLLIGTVPSFARLIHARIRELLSEDYVLAAVSLGASRLHIALRHLSPALLSLCRIKAVNLFCYALLAEATLSFLGVGAPIGRDTWGSLLAQSKDYLFEAPHIAIGAGIPLLLTVLSLQFLSERR